MKKLRETLGTFWFGTLFLTILGVVTYLPLAARMGYINDDWYLMFDGYIGGAKFFHDVFIVDRPLRGYLMQAAFSLFGMNPLYYHLSAFLFRVISAVSLFWIGNQLWSRRVAYNWLAALLFLVYPGFLSQVNPIDYQSQIFSLACGMVSVALTLKALQARTPAARWVYIIASVVLAWVYLGLVEYFLGFEALRFAMIVILSLRQTGQPVFSRLKSVAVTSLPFLAGMGGFLVWRLFFFEAERKATDVGLQLRSVFETPLTILWWLNYLIQDVFKVIMVAWTVPLNLFGFSLRLRDAFFGLGLSALAVVLLLLFLRQSSEKNGDDESNNSPGEMREQIWLAFITIVACLIPVILVNRHVILPDYSRYALAPSVGVGILFSVIFERVNTISLRSGLIAFLLGVSVLTHHGNAVRVADETEATRNFWWQVAWRAPKIQEGVTLIAMYPGSPLAEDYFIWGPANFIYYPEKQTGNPLIVKLPAAVLNGNTVTQITTNGGVETPLRRGNYLERDFGNVLVMVQSSSNSCVRFIDGKSPELNSYDDGRVTMIAPYSKLVSVITEGDVPAVPVEVFGAEPERGWCYTYQQANLARQRGDWDAIPVLLDDALDKGYYPNDGLEWMPFMQAYAVQGNLEEIQSMLKLVVADKYLRLQVCNSMTDLMTRVSLSGDVKALIEQNICK
ncbi:MAG: hypothetical protein HYU84_09255 [Chloroflexi bacterium]|nr:hypothetical protein [Chloroflexota bacterium]MBI3170890.1 hypothetical protein [Chloroflexota bacterium]